MSYSDLRWETCHAFGESHSSFESITLELLILHILRFKNRKCDFGFGLNFYTKKEKLANFGELFLSLGFKLLLN